MRGHRLSRRGLAIAAAVTLALLGTFVAAVAVLAVRVDGASMAPTLRDGDRVLLRPFSAGDTPPRFAVVVGRFTEGGSAVVKRVIALPGDRIEIAQADGEKAQVRVQPGGHGPWLEVDNRAWPTQWAGASNCCAAGGTTSAQPDPQVVPAGTVFVLGDNPAASEDSRRFGWAPIGLIDGTVAWRVHPWGGIGGVGSGVALRPAGGL